MKIEAWQFSILFAVVVCLIMVTLERKFQSMNPVKQDKIRRVKNELGNIAISLWLSLGVCYLIILMIKESL